MEPRGDGLPPSLAQIAPADMLNVWNQTKLSSKSGTVQTADGKHFLLFLFSLKTCIIQVKTNTIPYRCESRMKIGSELIFVCYFFYFVSFFVQIVLEWWWHTHTQEKNWSAYTVTDCTATKPICVHIFDNVIKVYVYHVRTVQEHLREITRSDGI